MFANEGKFAMLRAQNKPDGVSVDPLPLRRGGEATVLYYGLLANSGADQVWMHTGFGDAWEDIYDYPMEKTPWGFAKTFRVEKGKHLNLCFKDSANNWDNNNYRNWGFDVREW